MTPIDGDFLDMPGVSRSFGLPGAEDLEGQDSIAPVCDALRALGKLVRPLSIDLVLRAYRRHDQDAVPLRHPFWFIVDRAAEQELGLRPGTSGPEVRRVDALDPESLETVMAEALAAESRGPEVVIGWDEIRIDATEVRLPASLSEREVLTIGPAGFAFGVAVRHRSDGAWIRGPRSVGELPAIQVGFSGPFVRARITTYWSIWTPQGVGGREIDEAGSQLTKLGWKLRA
jgi:hypothetical protein